MTAGLAHAQGVGFTGGATVDPAQAYVGSYIESALIGGHLRLRPQVAGLVCELVCSPRFAVARTCGHDPVRANQPGSFADRTT